jgi:outer membrane protein assembly factor BamB
MTIYRQTLGLIIMLPSMSAVAQPCTGPLIAVTRASSPHFLRVLSEPTVGFCAEAVLSTAPGGVAVAPNGNFHVWSQNSGPLGEYERQTGLLVRIVVAAGAGGVLQGRDVELMLNGDILVAGGSAARIARFDGMTGQYLGDFVQQNAGGLTTCFGMGWGPNGNLFVGSHTAGAILEFDGTNGGFVRTFVPPGSINEPYDVAFGPDGSMYVSSVSEGGIYRFDGQTGAPLGRLNATLVPAVRGLAFHPNGNLLACSWQGPQGGGVYEFDRNTGQLLRLASSGSGAMFAAVNCQLAFTQQPSSRSFYVHHPIVLSTGASSSGPLFYQWRKDGIPLVNGGRIAGANSTTLAINPATLGDTGVYDVLVANGCRSVSSSPAAIEVICYANCDGSTAQPILNVEDFTCFINRFAVGDPYANCDGSTTSPVLNVEDFSCFINAFAMGCT